MDSQDHKIITASSTGHEGHGVYLCHRCGWPFPNPHPSSRHRRAHKKVCGKIEGYKIIHSDGDHHVAVSDDEHNTSDEDGHTPSENPFFERKVEGDLCNSQLLEVDGTRDKSELNNPPISDQIANDESVSVIPSNDILVKEDKLASDPQTLLAVEIKEEIFDKFASIEVKNALVDETRENVDSFVGVEKVSESVNQEETNEYSDVVSVVPCIDKNVEMAENENKKMGSNDKFSVESDISRVPEDDQIKRDLGIESNHFDDKSNSKFSEAMEVQLMLDSVNSTDLPTSCESGNLEKLSKTESISVANSFEKSVQEIDTGKEDIVHVTSDDVRVESADVDELKDDKDVVTSESIPLNPISKDSKLLIKSEDAAENICINENAGASESIDAAEVSTELNHAASVVISTEDSMGPASRMQESLPVNEKCSNGTSPDVVEEKRASDDVSISKSFGIVSCDDVRTNNLSVQDETATKQDEDDSAIDLSNIRSDSLEANCGSVSAFSSQSNMAVVETSSKSQDTLESNIYEPPSFMTLVQSSEIEKVHNNQHPKSDAHQAGWFPSITNVVNESEGRKKNEEIISKVTNWNPVKQQHGPLKNLLNELDSPNAKQVPNEPKDNGKDHETSKVIEEWNSPARYPIEIKKEKKKKRKPYWVPFVCCSSRHRDM